MRPSFSGTIRVVTHPTASRFLENLGFLVGLGLIVYRAVLPPVPPVPGVPWDYLIMCALLIAPKMLGKASAGRIWAAVGQKFGSPPPPPVP